MPALRLSIYYAAYFGGVGILLPFWPVWLSERGLSASEIGFLIAAATGIRVLTNPIIAQVADRGGERNRLMWWLSGLAAAAFAFFRFADGFWAILIVTLVYFSLWSATQPLAESLTMLGVNQAKLDYGRIRLWGSIAFIATSTSLGWLLTGRDADLIFSAALLAALVTFLACLSLPNYKAPKSEPRRLALWPVIRNRRFMVFLLSAGLIQASHAVLYGFGTIHWRQAGYADGVIGLFWAEGVVAEIILFALGAYLLRRFGAVRLILLGGICGTIRWGFTGITDDLVFIIILQGLHAFTFGATHLGAMHFISQTIEPRYSASAQSIYSAAVAGLAMGFAAFFSGMLYDLLGGRAYFAMSAVAAAGSLLAAVLILVDRNRNSNL
ncbi:MAG: 3-phenylpropionate MFS transporter [Rhodospirillales bacterium]|jgi:PPP family 3-phenylpropionic acid transporter|nr:3-phenylpropionate MFS transporter [Rhodospirillaceae bacterium]MDP6429122.1 3-phenylpropionate MFS transporter [Rhodospirillales bacterium]MDP6645694.1 3-phenylpropionate MFS transporter [Rhodospirillales bacterium]MDP6842865.1 3-phenylpropionate MFS transporter [Rhodospirillales bacterium]